MANPTITNVAFDKTSYVPGSKARLSFDVSDADTRDVTVDIKVTDAAGGVGSGTFTLKVVDVQTPTVTDSESRTWTQVSAVNGRYTYEATV